jgi:hypothetical protein
MMIYVFDTSKIKPLVLLIRTGNGFCSAIKIWIMFFYKEHKMKRTVSSIIKHESE